MELIKPIYYDRFRCLAGVCPDSCCKGWAVQVDEETAAMYRTLPGDLGDTLRAKLTEADGDTILSLNADGRCPMWRDDGLCRIHAELGAQALCRTCREFPRLRHDYGDFMELGLELSCPEAARLLLERQDCAVTVTQLPGGDAPEYDTEAMTVLRRSRHEALSFLSDTALDVGEALAVLLLYGCAVQSELDGGEKAYLDPQADLARAGQLAAPGDLGAILDFFAGLEILDPAWLARLRDPMGSQWQKEHRAMARYFVERYWLQAVSDYDLVGRVKLSVISCLVVKALGGNIYETAQRYSKEIENDPDNLVAILDSSYTSPALADLPLLGLLLEQ